MINEWTGIKHTLLSGTLKNMHVNLAFFQNVLNTMKIKDLWKIK